MSDPYAGRERVLTDEQRTTVAVWVNDIAARLGLRDWRVHVSPFAAFGDDALACSSLRDQASVSWIAVTRAWLESDDIAPRRRRSTGWRPRCRWSSRRSPSSRASLCPASRSRRSCYPGKWSSRSEGSGE